MMTRIGLLTLLLSIASDPCSAWTLADRLSGRFDPSSHTKRVMARRRGKPIDTRDSTSNSKTTKQYQQDMLNFIDQPMETMVGDAVNPSSSLPQWNSANEIDDDLLEFVKCIVKAADGRKAEDIVALKVNHVTTLTSVLVILSGNSRPQNQAIAAAIRKEVEEIYDMKPGGNGVPEGTAESGWMLLDYGSVMVHIMTPKSRLYYNVEGQWRDKGGESIDVSDVIIPNSIMEKPSGAVNGNNYVAEEDDPFWS